MRLAKGAGSGAVRGVLRLAGAAVMAVSGVASALAVQPIPIASGTYCGPGSDKIIVDTAKNQVTIDTLVCRFPVIAADHMQSDLCATPQGETVPHNFDLRVVGRDFIHAGGWYKRCGDVPAG